MRIGKKGNRRLKSATRSVYAMAAAFVVLFACSKPPADATKTDSASQKSTAVDTSAATGQTATPEKRARVVILGTSLTAGYGLDPEEAYPALLQQMVDSAKFNVTIVNAGLSGETSAGALRRAAWVLDQPADAVVLE